jgi:hypothetical protein
MDDPSARARAAALADAFLSGPWDEERMRRRGALVAPRARWLRPLIRAVLARFPAPPHVHRSALVAAIATAEPFRKAMARVRPPLAFPFLGPYEGGPPRWDVPALPTSGDLAAWLGLTIPDLDWLADRRNLLRSRREGPLHHYVSTWVPKRSGGARLLEAPKARLRAIQRRILREILDRVPRTTPRTGSAAAGRRSPTPRPTPVAPWSSGRTCATSSRRRGPAGSGRSSPRSATPRRSPPR